MQFNEKTLKSKTLYKGKVLTLKHDEVELIDKTTSYREVVEDSGGACVLCELDGKILFVRQFRYPYKEEVLELPAGKLNAGEDPKHTAIRELKEEGGAIVDDVELMFKCYPSPGYTNEIIHIYKAINPRISTAELDEGEFLSCEWIDIDKIKQMLKNQEITDGKTLIALLSHVK